MAIETTVTPSTAVKIKSNDTGQIFNATLKINGTVANLAGATVLFLLKLSESPFTAYSLSASVVTAADGTVRCLASVSGFPTVAGTYKQEWEVTFSDATKLTFPSSGYNFIQMLDDLN
jgi:hypothetical protein